MVLDAPGCSAPRSLLALAAVLFAAAAGAGVLPLQPGGVFEQTIAEGEAQEHALALKAGRFVRLAVEQRGIDVEITVLGEGGQLVARANNPSGQDVPEALSLVTDEDAVYRLEVRGLPGTAGPGRYVLRIEEEREAAPADRLRMTAERAEAAADQLYLQSTKEGFAQALDAYGDALARWREVGEPAEEAEVLYRLALTRRRRGERREALQRLDEALALQRRLGERSWQATILNQKGLVFGELGEHAQALAALEEALALRRELGDPGLEAPVLNNIGLIHHYLGNLREARSVYVQALEIFRRTGDRRREASVLGNLGSVHELLGEPLESLRFHEEQLALARAGNDREVEATALNNLGLAKHRLGELQGALESYSAALEAVRALGDRPREATALSNLGTLSLELGEPEPAVAAFEQALALQRETGARAGEALTLSNLGRAQSALGRSAEALAAFEQALAIQAEIGDRVNEAAARSHLGAHLTSQGRPREALEPLRKALEIAREVGDRPAEARAAQFLGAAYSALGDATAASSALTGALSLQRALSDPVGEVETLQQIARVERAQGNLEGARSRLEAALELVESLRVRLTADRLRSSYFASVHETYEACVDVLMALHERHPEAGLAALAFEVAERARARSLLDLLREARVEIRRGADPRLLEEERRRRGELRAKAGRQRLLLQGKPTEEQAAQAQREVEDALAAYRLAEAKLYAALPSYAGLVQPATVSRSEVQELLDGETALLEMALGPERSFLWVVTRSSFTVHVLPGRAGIEAAAEEAHRLLREPDPRGNPRRRELLARLGAMLLGPVADRQDVRRLAIVAPTVLQYLPFAALPVLPGGPAVERYEVVSLPSAAVLRELRHKAASRPAVTGELAILADPVFEAGDPRVPKAAPASAAPGQEGGSREADLERLVRNLGPAGFQRLSWTRREAEAIAKQAGAVPVLLSLDFQASLDAVAGPDLARHRRLHFATHGFLDDRHPELSGLVLSLVDPQGRPRDGFLRLVDVYNLDLAAELVVLSGCQTALGRQVRGEGLVGLTRGFFYAGASHVVASLWPVRDRATAELMEKFYRAHLQEGLKPAAALRAAQLAMRKDPRWRDPYYWAPFVAHGDWQGSRSPGVISGHLGSPLEPETERRTK